MVLDAINSVKQAPLFALQNFRIKKQLFLIYKTGFLFKRNSCMTNGN